MLDVSEYELNGKELETLLDEVGITVNKNAIPFDKLPPSKTSGIRVGTPAITTRGFGVTEAKKVAELIIRTAQSKDQPEALEIILKEVHDLTSDFPLYKKGK